MKTKQKSKGKVLRKSSFRSSKISSSTDQITFIIDGKPITSDRNFIASKSEYFKEFISQFSNDQEIQIIMPKWTTKIAFNLLIRYLNDESICGIDIANVQPLLWLSDFFKLNGLTEFCINSLILPKLTKDNVLGLSKTSNILLSYLFSLLDYYQSLTLLYFSILTN